MDATATSEGHKYAHLYNYSGSNKAGMDGMDKDKQAQIIYEMSKDSAYFKRAAKLDAEADAKVQGLKKTLQEVKGPLEEKLRKDVQRMELDLEPRRSFKRICCVLDMDMFYAAVEIRDKPHLKDLPVAVGGMTMISTANYVARKYGVRAAMPGFIAKKLCPQLVFVDMNFDKYRHISEQVKDIIGEYDPDFSSHSLDEVYFDLTNAATDVWRKRRDGNKGADPNSRTEDTEKHRDEQPTSTLPSGLESVPDIDIFVLRSIAVEVLQEIRRRITEVTGGLTCSAGLANNHYLAKIGADVNKPDGQFELPPTREAVMDFVTTLPTRKVTGIGKVTERMLDSLLAVKTMGQVRDHLPQLLHTVTPILFQFLLRTCMGIGSHEGEDNVTHELNVSEKKGYMRKSLGCERTFASKGIWDPTELYARLHKICQHVADDMASEGLWAKAVTLKLKNIDFELITRIASSQQYFQSVETIESLAKTMLDEALPVNIRLMGVSVSKFKQPDASESDPKQRNMLMFLKAKEEREEGHTENEKTGGTSPDGDVTYRSPHSNGAAAEKALIRDTAESRNFIDIDEGGEESEVEVLNDCVASPASRNVLFNAPKGTHGREESGAAPTTIAGVRSTSSADTSVTQQLHECPVCGAQVPGMLARFNQHLDMCLGLFDEKVEDKGGDEPTSGSNRKGPSGKGPRQATKNSSKISGASMARTNAQVLPSGAANNPLLAAFGAATSTSTSTTKTKAPSAAPSDLSTHKRPNIDSSASKLSTKHTGPTSASSSDNQRGKMPRREPLALEITDYFTFQ